MVNFHGRHDERRVDNPKSEENTSQEQSGVSTGTHRSVDVHSTEVGSGVWCDVKRSAHIKTGARCGTRAARRSVGTLGPASSHGDSSGLPLEPPVSALGSWPRATSPRSQDVSLSNFHLPSSFAFDDTKKICGSGLLWLTLGLVFLAMSLLARVYLV